MCPHGHYSQAYSIASYNGAAAAAADDDDIRPFIKSIRPHLMACLLMGDGDGDGDDDGGDGRC